MVLLSDLILITEPGTRNLLHVHDDPLLLHDVVSMDFNLHNRKCPNAGIKLVINVVMCVSIAVWLWIQLVQTVLQETDKNKHKHSNVT